jgi:hypothetical protein
MSTPLRVLLSGRKDSNTEGCCYFCFRVSGFCFIGFGFFGSRIPRAGPLIRNSGIQGFSFTRHVSSMTEYRRFVVETVLPQTLKSLRQNQEHGAGNVILPRPMFNGKFYSSQRSDATGKKGRRAVHLLDISQVSRIEFPSDLHTIISHTLVYDALSTRSPPKTPRLQSNHPRSTNPPRDPTDPSRCHSACRPATRADSNTYT